MTNDNELNLLTMEHPRFSTIVEIAGENISDTYIYDTIHVFLIDSGYQLIKKNITDRDESRFYGKKEIDMQFSIYLSRLNPNQKLQIRFINRMNNISILNNIQLILNNSWTVIPKSMPLHFKIPKFLFNAYKNILLYNKKGRPVACFFSTSPSIAYAIGTHRLNTGLYIREYIY